MKQILLALLLALCFASEVFGAGTRVQKKFGQADNGSTNLPITFDSTVTTGNLIALVCAWPTLGDGRVITGVTDSGSNSYSIAATAIQDVTEATETRVEIWVAQNVTGGSSFTVTPNWGTETWKSCEIVEYSGLATTGAVEDTSTGEATGTAASSGEVTAAAGAVYLAGVTIINTGGGSTFTPGGSFNQLDEDETDGIQPINVSDLVSSGAQTATWTLGTSSEWAAVIVALKEAAAATTTRRRVIIFQ